jgi:hypothetical protein
MALKRKLIIFGIISVIAFILAIQLTFFNVKECRDFECFKNEMKKCNRATYINEELEATWKYEILDSDSIQCNVEVTLLQPKAGELGIEQLAGSTMICRFPKGIGTYPERDLERCSGKLKEELQEIVIRKLHTYIIENIGELEQGLELIISQN